MLSLDICSSQNRILPSTRLGSVIGFSDGTGTGGSAAPAAEAARTAKPATDAAKAVVVNADFGHAMTTLVPDRLRRRWTDAKIARSEYSCSTFMMSLGIEGSYDLPHHNIYIARDYARNLEEIEKLHVLSEDPSFYVQNACVTDSTLAPPGHSTLYVLVPVSHMHPNIDWNR